MRVLSPMILAALFVAGAAYGQSDRRVDVAQIADGSRITVRQSAATASAAIFQTADRSTIDLDQSGRGSTLATLTQSGAYDRIDVRQQDSASLAVVQAGTDNAIGIGQRGGSLIQNVAAISQTGTGNALSLTQTGSDNAASLTQQGDGNQMTATQTGNGNQLSWLQAGNNLSDLGITQTGGQSAAIVQTRGR